MGNIQPQVNYLDRGKANDSECDFITLDLTDSPYLGVAYDDGELNGCDDDIAIFYFLNPPTGTPDLRWQWNEEPDFDWGGLWAYACYKGVDLDDPIRDRGYDLRDDTYAETPELAALPGDMIFSVFGHFINVDPAWTGATEVADMGEYDEMFAEAAESAPTGNQTVRAENALARFEIIASVVLKSAPILRRRRRRWKRYLCSVMKSFFRR